MNKPSLSFMLNSILDNENCNEEQSANNISFLEHIETCISGYIFDFDFDFDFSIEIDYECYCESECDQDCYINTVVGHKFKDVVENLELELENNPEFDFVNEKYTDDEFVRISNVAYTIAQILIYRELGRWAFHFGYYQTGVSYHGVATLLYGSAIATNGKNATNFIDSEISLRNQKAADTRWEAHRKNRVERKNRYLQIMKDKEFSTYSDTAAYIKMHIDTGKSPSFNTICRLLSEADKGDFS